VDNEKGTGARDMERTEGKGPVTNCVRCDRWMVGPGPALCEQCRSEGYELCANCGLRVTNGTTPYCDVCAEEIVGTG
jgi:RecJ-like exonuclease